MKKLVVSLFVILLISGCAAKPNSVDETSKPDEKEVKFTPPPPGDRELPTPNGEITDTSEFNFIKTDDKENVKITIYYRNEDTIGDHITFFDSTGKILSDSNGFSTVDDYIVINDELPFEQHFGATSYTGEGDPKVDMDSEDYIKISCSVYLKGKVDTPCSETYVFPRYAGYEYKIYLIKDESGNYKFSSFDNKK